MADDLVAVRAADLDALEAELARLRAAVSPGFIRARPADRPPKIVMRPKPAPLDIGKEQHPL